MLIINADDWGGWPEATDAALECFGRSWINSTSAMVFMADSERGAELGRECGIDIGLHLNLSQEFTGEGVPVALRTRHMRVARFLNFNRYAQIVYNPSLRGPLELLVRAQIEEFERLYGKPPSHIDGHQHMHLCANMMVANLLPARFKVRRSFSFQPGEKNRLNRAYRCWLDRRVSKRHRSTDFFLALSQNAAAEKLAFIANVAQKQNVELMAHPAVQLEQAIMRSKPYGEMLAAAPVGTYTQL
jgi:predicted glycoside hydrolase/deacetylase ChbG (UPF0249 family)